MKKILHFPFQSIILIALLGLLSGGKALYGQALLRGLVYERIADRPLPLAKIEILETTLQDISDERGEYLIQHIPVGTYKVKFSKEGYRSVIRVITVEKAENGPTQVFSLGVGLGLEAAFLVPGAIEDAHGFSRKQLHSPFAIEKQNRAQLNRWQPVTLGEGLSRMTGVWQTGGGYGIPSVGIRGLDERRQALLFEGISFSPSLQGVGSSPILSVFDPLSIGAVSVQRGTGNTRSGIGMSGGQINLYQQELAFSGAGVEVHGQANYQFQAPSQAHQGRLALSLHSPKIAVRLGATGTLMEGLRPGGIRQTFSEAGYDRRNADAQALIRINPRQELSLGYRVGQLNALDLQGNLRPPFFERFLDERRHQIGFARLRTHIPEGTWVKRIDFTASYQEFEETRKASLGTDAGPAEAFPQQENSLETYSSKLEVFSELTQLWHFVSGVDASIDRAGGLTTLYDQQTDGFTTRRAMLPEGSQSGQVSLYSLHTLDILKLRLTLGGRAQFDSRNYTLEGRAASNWQSLRTGWSVSGMYPLSEAFQLISNVQSGYRAPSLFELAGQGGVPNGLAIANDSLLGEQSLTSEIGLKAETDRVRGTVMLYRTRVNDWIGYMPSTLEGQSVVEGQSVFMAENLGKVFLSGIEATVEVPVNRAMSVYGNLSYNYGTRTVAASPLSRIPPLNSRLGMHYHHRLGVWGQLEWRYADAQNRLSLVDELDPATTESFRSWQTVDVKLGYDFRWGYASIGVLNLLDERYMFFGTDYLQPGRRIVASLQLGF